MNVDDSCKRIIVYSICSWSFFWICDGWRWVGSFLQQDSQVVLGVGTCETLINKALKRWTWNSSFPWFFQTKPLRHPLAQKLSGKISEQLIHRTGALARGYQLSWTKNRCTFHWEGKCCRKCCLSLPSIIIYSCIMYWLMTSPFTTSNICVIAST